MTNRARFSEADWSLLVLLPRWVAKAASAAQPDIAIRTQAEAEAGLISLAEGRRSGNPFVEEVARHVVEVFDDRATKAAVAAVDFTDPEAGVVTTLERAATAWALLTASDQGDAAAYRQWLLAVSDVVIKAARSGDVLGFGGQRVTALERSFYDRLAQTLV